MLQSSLSRFTKTITETKLRIVSFGLVIGFTLLAIFAPIVIPSTAIYQIHTNLTLEPPSRLFPFGTDIYGRSLLQLCLLSITTDLQLSYAITAASVVIGIIIGALAGYGRSAVDEILMRFTDVFLSIPAFILAMAVAVAVGHTLYDLAAALVITFWPAYARIVRGQVLSERNKLYVDSLKLMNIPKLRVLFNHILPNVIYPILAFLTIQIGVTILFLSGLTFIGFGSGPFTPELGRIISDGLNYFFDAPWIVLFPGLILSLIVFSFNLLGDALRDILDPRLRNIRRV
jgi:peptide/nickel transport system permease protein